MRLAKYYPSSRTTHIRQEGPVAEALCGKQAQFAVETPATDRLALVTCTGCRSIYMERVKATKNGTAPSTPADEGGLAGLLQALAWTDAHRMGYRKAAGAVVERLLDGYS